MTPFVAVIAIVAALNPFAAAARLGGERPTPRQLIAAGTLSAACYALAAAFADSILDALSVEPESFLVAAAVVIAASGAATIAFGPLRLPFDPASRFADLVPLTVPVLLGPAGLAAVLVVAARESAGWAIAGALAAVGAALALAAARFGAAGQLADGLARLAAGLAVVIAAGFAVDGVRSI